MVEATQTNHSEEEVKVLPVSLVAGEAGEAAKKKKKRNKKKKGATAAQGDDVVLDAPEEEKNVKYEALGGVDEESKA